ncbi:MAG TPA: PD-(D/E)XK nuclease-like domain-containing protein [Gemmatimonadaceae bacterium]|nr:PD-(D/E)XK nuclease-like domain-containing protein [Gemmatimonadaceae bacterium]
MIQHGIHLRLSEADYHRRELGMVSKSGLDLVRRSPAHYKAWVDGQDGETTPAMAFGKAFHCAILEPDVFSATYTVEPDFGDCRFKDNKSKRDEWRAASVGKTPLTVEDGAAITAMAKAVHDHPRAGRMLTGGDAEVTARWQDPETSLECKARGDYLRRDLRMLIDVKTTTDASPLGFPKSFANYGYFRQEALYRDGFNAAGAPVDLFAFIAVEKVPPYALAIYTLEAEDIQRGRDSVRRDMVTLAECLRRNEWPGYPEEIQTLKLPSWAA